MTSFSKICWWFSLFIMLWVSTNLHWGKDNWQGILESDAKGYYAYLPAIFIYDDLNFGFLDSVQAKYPAPHLDYDYRAHDQNGTLINKYYAGVAVMQAPFFLVAHWITQWSGGEADGYSKWYLISVNLAALFYLFLGLWYLRKSLLLKGIAEKWVGLLLLCVLFGSNLFVYSVVEPGMSHVFSFSLFSIWLFQVLSIQKDHKHNRIYILAFVAGLIIMVRPINGLIIFSLPFILGSWKELSSFFSLLKSPKVLLLSLMLFAFFPFLQLLYYKTATTSYLVYSYENEGFDFTNPQIINILFSYKKGLFLYTPFYFLSFVGLFRLWKQNRFTFLAWFLFFGLITYVFSSWWMWYYGGSFSSRVYVEYLPFFALLFSFAYAQDLKPWKQNLWIGILLLVIVLCQIQSYQYRYYIIHYSEMTMERYWEVFLQMPLN